MQNSSTQSPRGATLVEFMIVVFGIAFSIAGVIVGASGGFWSGAVGALIGLLIGCRFANFVSFLINRLGSSEFAPTKKDLDDLVRLYQAAKNSLISSTNEHSKEVASFARYITSSSWRLHSYTPEDNQDILDNIESATLNEVRSVLTCFSRSERFCDGAWVSSIEAGTLEPVMNRVQEIFSA